MITVNINPIGILTSVIAVIGASVISSTAAGQDAGGVPGLYSLQAPSVEVELAVETQRIKGQDAPNELKNDAAGLGATLTIGIEQVLRDRTRANAEFDLDTNWYSDSRLQDNDNSFSLRTRQLYIQHRFAKTGFRARVGRQTLDDDMGWLIDEDLDGIRFTYKRNGNPIDVSYSRQDWLKVDSMDREDRTYNLLGSWRVEFNKKSTVMPYVLHRSKDEFEGSSTSETSWVGVQALGRVKKPLRFWFNSAVRSGERRRSDDTESLSGFAVDTGATWVFDKRYKPSVTVGLAHASGDSGDGDDKDKSFRQSGLHSNKFRFNGLTRFKYLGEVLDPELTNIDILTIGAGARLNKTWSLDVVYHSYRQAAVENRLHGADFETDPDGQSDNLGDAVDLIFGYRHSKALDLTAAAGVFNPGSAFAPSTENAWLVNIELEYKF